MNATGLPFTATRQEDPILTYQRQSAVRNNIFRSVGDVTAESLWRTTPFETYRALSRVGAMDTGYEITEDQWRKSSSYREGLYYFKGMTQAAADDLATDFDMTRDLALRASRGTAWATLPGGLLGGLPDPINFVPVLGPAQKALGAARIARGLSGFVGKTAAEIAGAGLVQSAEAGLSVAVAQPVVYGLAKFNQEEYEMETFAANVLVGAGIGFGFGAAGKTLGMVLGHRAKNAAIQKSVADFAQGEEVDVSTVIKDAIGLQKDAPKKSNVSVVIEKDRAPHVVEDINVEPHSDIVGDIETKDKSLLRYNYETLAKKETWEAAGIEQPRAFKSFDSREDASNYLSAMMMDLDNPIHSSMVKEFNIEGSLRSMGYEQRGDFWFSNDALVTPDSMVGAQQHPDFNAKIDEIANMPLEKIARDFPEIAAHIREYAREFNDTLKIGADVDKEVGKTTRVESWDKTGGQPVATFTGRSEHTKSSITLKEETELEYDQFFELLDDVANMKHSTKGIREGRPKDFLRWLMRSAIKDSIVGQGITEKDLVGLTSDVGTFRNPNRKALIEFERHVYGDTFDAAQRLDFRKAEPEVGVPKEAIDAPPVDSTTAELQAEAESLLQSIGELTEAEQRAVDAVAAEMEIVSEASDMLQSAIDCVKGVV